MVGPTWLGSCFNLWSVTTIFMQVGIASLYVASKCEEYYPADLKKLVHLTENSYEVQDVFDMELVLLGVIHFQVYSIPASFLY